MKINILTHSEEQLMKVAWPLESFFMKDLVEAYPDPKPHPNTISTYLKILTEKQYLSTEKVGRIFKYSISISRETYLSCVLEQMVDRHFASDKEMFAKFLVDHTILSIEEFKHLFQVKTTIIPIKENDKAPQNPISELIEDITKSKKKKKKEKKKKK